MIVCVLNADGKPMMPSKRNGKVRRLLKEGKAKVVNKSPFTIQLLEQIEEPIVQKVSMGMDAGSKHIGYSVTTENEVLMETEVILRTDIPGLLEARSSLRGGRRYRKVRYRKARFENRRKVESGFRKKKAVDTKHKRPQKKLYNVYSKEEQRFLRFGKDKVKTNRPPVSNQYENKWYAPSIRAKADSHISYAERMYRVFPISETTIELANFDVQLLKNPKISGVEYQNGEMVGWNTREYVLWRDGFKCQHCKGKSKDKILQVHHIVRRRDGGSNAPSNLVTLCKTCHENYHKGLITNWKIKKGASYKDAAFMNVVRGLVYDKLKELHPNIKVTYGYITKNTRIANNLPKEHIIDARCISGNPTAKPLIDSYVLCKKKRCHNRQLHKTKFIHGGTRPKVGGAYIINGTRLYDKCKYKGQIGYVASRPTKAKAVWLYDINGQVITRYAKVGEFRVLYAQQSYISDLIPYENAV